MVTFDQALPELVRLCEQHPQARVLRRVCVVRDPRGRLRLVVDPDKNAGPFDPEALRKALSTALAAYFPAPLLSTADPDKDQARIAATLFDRSEAWQPEFHDPATGRKQAALTWRKIERRLSKHQWLDAAEAAPPWKLHPSAPPIVTFYSFKGGVGRTTALLACAWQLARAGKRVALVDLDLEAPGLGALGEVRTDRGVIDYIVEHIATGTGNLEHASERPSTLGEVGDRLDIFPAGNLDDGFLEKLARVDFGADSLHGPSNASPAETAIDALLRQIKTRHRPDYIFIDSRAGLHDLAGLSLHRLAHLDVLVSRAGEQGYRGLDIALAALCRRKGPVDLVCRVVHTMAPDRGTPEAQAEERAFLRRCHAIYTQHVYRERGETLDEDARDAPHAPLVVRHNPRLMHITHLSDVVRELESPDYTELCDTLCTLVAHADEDP